MSKKLIYLISIVLVLAGSAWVPICQGDLISWWPLDSLDGSGQFPDLGGDMDNPGTPVGNTAVDTVVKKISAGSALFDGSGDYIDVGQGDLMLLGESALTVRTSRWKLMSETVRKGPNWLALSAPEAIPHLQLYDMQHNRTELNDLARKPEYQSVAGQLYERWQVWAKQVGVRPWDLVRKAPRINHGMDLP